MTTTIFAPAMDLTWKVIESYGCDPAPLFESQHIDVRKISDPNARASKTGLNAVWAEAVKLIDDPSIGLRTAEFLHPSHMGALGYAWLASTSLRTALNRLSRYVHFIADNVEVDLEESNGNCGITVREGDVNHRMSWASDSSLAILITLCRTNYGDSLNPVSVDIQHAEPRNPGNYFSLFKCPVRFGQEVDRITLKSEELDKKLPSANPQLAQLGDQVMIQTLARLSKERIVPRVKSVIIYLLPSGNVNDEMVAEALNMSTRALQRKLQKKETTFKQLLTEIRQELADKYIRNNQLSLTEISFMLGFSEVSSFSRAFKRWTGESPSEYRYSAQA